MTYSMKPHTSKLEEMPENKLDVTYSHNVGQTAVLEPQTDAVFGNIGENGPNYRDV